MPALVKRMISDGNIARLMNNTFGVKYANTWRTDRWRRGRGRLSSDHRCHRGGAAAITVNGMSSKTRAERKHGGGGDAISHAAQHLCRKSHFPFPFFPFLSLSFLFRGLLLLIPLLHFHADASITALRSLQ